MTSAELAAAREPAAAARERPPVVSAILTSRNGVLVTRRRDGRPPWAFAGGAVERGESPGDAGIRELREETGVLAIAEQEIGRRVHPATGRLMIYVACRLAGSTPPPQVADPDELLDVRWATRAEALDLMPDMFEPVREYLARTLRPDEPGA